VISPPSPKSEILDVLASFSIVSALAVVLVASNEPKSPAQ